jgi:hypothetical protein
MTDLQPRVFFIWLYRREHITYYAPTAVLCKIRNFWPRYEGIGPIFHVVVLREVVQVALLYFGEILRLCSSNVHLEYGK